MHVGWIDGGVLIVPQSTQRPPSSCEHLVGAAREQRALGRHAHRDRLAARRELAAGAQHLGVRRRPAVVGEAVARRAAAPGTGASAAMHDAGGPAAAGADDGDGAGRVERAERAEQRRRGRGVAERGVDRRPTAASVGAELAARRSRRAGRRGRGATTRATSSAARCSPTSRTDGRNISSRKRRAS